MSEATHCRWFQRLLVNDTTGERYVQSIGCTRVPFDVSTYQANEGWRVEGPINELDEPAIGAEALDRFWLVARAIYEEHNPGWTLDIHDRESRPKPKVIAVHACNEGGWT